MGDHRRLSRTHHSHLLRQHPGGCPAAYLLRVASLQQRHHRHLPRLSYIPGPQNTLTDIASRRFDLTDSQLLTLLDRIALQIKPWQMRHPSPAMLSFVISALQSKRHARPRRA